MNDAPRRGRPPMEPADDPDAAVIGGALDILKRVAEAADAKGLKVEGFATHVAPVVKNVIDILDCAQVAPQSRKSRAKRDDLVRAAGCEPRKKAPDRIYAEGNRAQVGKIMRKINAMFDQSPMKLLRENPRDPRAYHFVGVENRKFVCLGHQTLDVVADRGSPDPLQIGRLVHAIDERIALAMHHRAIGDYQKLNGLLRRALEICALVEPLWRTLPNLFAVAKFKAQAHERLAKMDTAT